jgi:hypothetical protein
MVLISYDNSMSRPPMISTWSRPNRAKALGGTSGGLDQSQGNATCAWADESHHEAADG